MQILSDGSGGRENIVLQCMPIAKCMDMLLIGDTVMQAYKRVRLSLNIEMAADQDAVWAWINDRDMKKWTEGVRWRLAETFATVDRA